MDFGALYGLMSSENNKNTLISWGDSDHKTKWVGSGGGFCNHESSVSAMATGTHEDDISKTMLLQHHRSNGPQNMLSFSLPSTQSYGAGGQFTASQWMELEHQALIYKYITANAAVPSNLLIPIRKALETAGGNFRQNAFGWGALHVGFCNGSDPEPGRCRRTDGKKWRCAKNAVGDQKYCERHINRGRHRSRKPVEAQNCHSIPPTATVAAPKLTTGATVLSHAVPISKVPSQDNRKANLEAAEDPMLSSSSIPLKKTIVSDPKEQSSNTEFGLVCSDSLLNPVHKSDAQSQHLLHRLMEDWPHSSRTTREGLDLEEHRVPGGPLGEVLQHSTSIGHLL